MAEIRIPSAEFPKLKKDVDEIVAALAKVTDHGETWQQATNAFNQIADAVKNAKPVQHKPA